MAAEWYYVANQQQAGPVELHVIQQMLAGGALSSTDMVFGPGLSQWARAGQVPALSPAGGAAQWGAASSFPVAGAPQMINYHGAESGGSGLSPTAMDSLRQTKPWARFIAVMMFIAAGLMLVCGVCVMFAGAMMSGRARPAVGFPVWIGIVYLIVGGVYLGSAIFLNRYAGGLANLMQTNRMNHLEQALAAQKSFWKFTGIMMIIVMGIYAVAIVVMIWSKM